MTGVVERRLRAAVESSPSGLLMIDPSGKIVLVNREVERLFGYSREELLGQPVEILVPERFREGHPGFRGGFFAEPRVRAMGAGRDLYGRRKDGGEVPVEIGLTPVATEEGLFVISSIVDIGARKRAEERFRVAVESSPSGMVMVDGKGRIVLVNREVERLFGYDREELLGQSIEVLVPERFRDRHPEDRRAFYSDPRARSMGAGRDLFGLHKDGTEIPVEIGLNPIETEEGLFVLSSIVDISARQRAEEQRRELEEQLLQSQKMEAVGRLAGGIAHDFNNVLAAIVGFAELAHQESTDAATASDLAEILKASGRGKELVERILSFSRKRKIVRRPLDLEKSVSDSARLLRATLPAAIEIRLQADPQLPRALADATSVHQVLMNLVTNAADAMAAGGGVLDIGVEPFYARDSFVRAHPGLQEGEYVRLWVKDSGSGMDEATRSRAFEPFYSTKPEGRGSGLGLSMVHRVTRDLGGAVWLDSEVGVGTEVSCLFPVAPEASASDAGPESLLPRGRGQRVLFVDDESSLVRATERSLTLLGYSVVATVGSEAGLAAMRADPRGFDLLITDFSMPKMNGLELAREARSLRPDLPVLVASGFLEELPAEAVASAGVRAVLRKPVSLRELAQAVAHALDPTGRPPAS